MRMLQKEKCLSEATCEQRVLTNCRVVGGGIVFSSHEGVWRQESVCAVFGSWLVGWEGDETIIFVIEKLSAHSFLMGCKHGSQEVPNQNKMTDFINTFRESLFKGENPP